jgi:hypothetical protein
LAHFTTIWQEFCCSPEANLRISGHFSIWHDPCLTKAIAAGSTGGALGRAKMLSPDRLAHIVTAALGALTLSSLSIMAAAGPLPAGPQSAGWITAEFKAPPNG